MNTSNWPKSADVVRQISLLMPLVEAIRTQLRDRELASLCRTTHGFPYVAARTEHGGILLAFVEDGRYALYSSRCRYACDPKAAKDAIYNVIRRALNDAREGWACSAGTPNRTTR